MSAKGRGRHEGGEFDYYPTPAWCVDRLLDRVGAELFAPRDDIHRTQALEPTAGDGAIVRAVDDWFGRMRHGEVRPAWTVVEMRENALRAPLATFVDAHEGVDYRTWRPTLRFDVSIQNPPYALAEAIIRKALGECRRVAALLRTGFLGSDERTEFWRTVGANPALYVLPDRPSFDGVGSDSATYAWFVWGDPALTGVHMLDSTPLAVRNAQKPQSIEFQARQGALFSP